MSKQAEIQLLKNMLAKAEAELAAEQTSQPKPQGIWPIVNSGSGALITQSDEWANKHYLYQTINEADRIAYALQVFGEINRHPLAVVPVADKHQWFPFYTRSFGWEPEYSGQLSAKLRQLLPCFNSSEDCKQAISDVGANRLTLAAKYWKGLE